MGGSRIRRRGCDFSIGRHSTRYLSGSAHRETNGGGYHCQKDELPGAWVHRSRVRLGSAHSDDELAHVGAVEEHVDRGGQLLEALDDGLQGLEAAVGHPLGELAGDLGELGEMVEDDEALQGDALDEQVAEVGRAGWGLGVVVGGDQAAEGDAGRGR